MVNDNLRQRWEAATARLAREMHPPPASSDAAIPEAAAALTRKWLGKLADRYGEPHRAYHNMSHVEDVLASLGILMDAGGEESAAMAAGASMPADVAVVTLAAFFHDAIYDPKSATNEKDSADLFLEFASELDGALARRGARCAGMVDRVEECVIATATHVASANEARGANDTLLATFLDADMSVLGRDAAKYDEYAGCIRREYRFVERSVYCEKRAGILESFLPTSRDARDSQDDGKESNGTSSREISKEHSFIYATGKGREQWENQARVNLRREIDMLRTGIIPCEEEKDVC